jgi:hypothetical protein
VFLAWNTENAFLRCFPPRGYDLDSLLGLKHALVTLHRPPPETFTFERSLLDFSKIVTFEFGWCSLTENAEKKPAAPPPIIATFIFKTDLLKVH